jgi:hypothetical protein
VQALPSLQLVPSAFAGFVHSLVLELQTPGLWQSFSAGQTKGVPRHVPPAQASSTVHPSPSSHAVPAALAGVVH